MILEGLENENGLLSYNDLCYLIDKGVITNADKSMVNSASIDLTLGGHILSEDNINVGIAIATVSLARREPLHMIDYFISKGADHELYNEVFRLMPGQFVLAQSEQIFHLPDNISAEYKLKSSLARIGLEHMNAGWCDAGWHGSVLTLEFKNMTNFHAIDLRRGDPIGQVVFLSHKPVPDHASYRNRGRYNNDKEVSGIKQ